MTAHGDISLVKIHLQISAIKFLITITFSDIKNLIVDIKNSYPGNE